MQWPRENERLFREDRQEAHLNACLDFHHGSLDSCAYEYCQAAEALLSSASRGDCILDAIIRPAVFLYRQYIELSLKNLINLSRQLCHRPPGYPKHHKLDSLWVEAKQLLIELYGDKTPLELHNIDSCIAEFASHDPGSFAFRYPTDVKGMPTHPNLKRIHIGQLNETMERIGSFFNCIGTDLDNKLDWLHERGAEMRQNCP